METMHALQVNGESRTVRAEPGRLLLEVLREDMALTGTKYGCGEGECGACVVLLGDKRVFSCQTTIGDVAGRPITTIEGLAKGDKLHPVQEAFLAQGAFQCGYCTGGMILGAVALLRQKPNPSDDEIKTWVNAQICRCCAYPQILAAIREAVQEGAKP